MKLSTNERGLLLSAGVMVAAPLLGLLIPVIVFGVRVVRDGKAKRLAAEREDVSSSGQAS